MTSSNWDIQNLRNVTLANVLKTICVKCHQNQPSPLRCRADRQTDLMFTISLLPELPGPKASPKIVCAVLNKIGSYQLILLIFDSKHRVPLGYILSKVEENLTKITTVRVPQTLKQNGCHDVIQIEISKIWEKSALAHVLKTICVNLSHKMKK